MTRSPLFYPLNRGGDADAGGAADLQTDVMRFMAILSLCLVAIFALVQSIPLTPTVEDPSPVVVEQADPQTESELHEQIAHVEPDPVKIEAVQLTRPAIARLSVSKQNIVLQRAKPVPVQESKPAAVETAPQSQIADAKPRDEGFTLRFENDSALTRLVGQQVVGLYAMTPEKSLRMNIDHDEISFWPSSLPGKFHEMDQSTVPADVVSALRRSNQISDIRWGVTLPAEMSRELNNYLTSASGGSLVIASSGEIDLRRGNE